MPPLSWYSSLPFVPGARAFAHDPARFRGSTEGWPGTPGPSALGRPGVRPLPDVRATDVSSSPPCRVIPAGGYARASVSPSVWRPVRIGRREWPSESRAWRVMQNLSFASSPSSTLSLGAKPVAATEQGLRAAAGESRGHDLRGDKPAHAAQAGDGGVRSLPSSAPNLLFAKLPLVLQL
jgi:hypothetical protein